MNPLTSMIVASTVASALVGGVFFAFSVFVMRALTDLPPAQGILAMQRVNIPVINPLFLGVFLGSAALLGVTAYVGGPLNSGATLDPCIEQTANGRLLPPAAAAHVERSVAPLTHGGIRKPFRPR